MSEYIEKLSEAIAAVHECRCSHFGTEHVCEVSFNETIWEGDIEIFHLEDHPDTKIAYGWGWDAGEGEIEYIGVLQLPPVDSPRAALKAAIMSGSFTVE